MENLKIAPIMGMNGIYRVFVDGRQLIPQVTKIVGGSYSYRNQRIDKGITDTFLVGDNEFPNLVSAVRHIESNHGE